MQGGMEYYQAQPARGGGGASAAAQVAQHQIQYQQQTHQQHGHAGSTAAYYPSGVNSSNSMYFQTMSSGHNGPPPPQPGSQGPQTHGHYGGQQSTHHTQQTAQQHYGLQQSGQPSWDGGLSSHHQSHSSMSHHTGTMSGGLTSGGGGGGGVSRGAGGASSRGAAGASLSAGNGSAAYTDGGYSGYGGAYGGGVGASMSGGRGQMSSGGGGGGGLGDHHGHHSMSQSQSHHGHAGFQTMGYGPAAAAAAAAASSTQHHVQHQQSHLGPSHHGSNLPAGAVAASMRPVGGPVVAQELPLRMVVEAKFVGAIIGQGGSSIREITRESRARCVVDVQRTARDVPPTMSSGGGGPGGPGGQGGQQATAEKVISILGQPENCSRACVKILEVIQREQEKDAGPDRPPQEVELKMRAANQLVGRLIGKQGATIKRIMQETGAVVFVSKSGFSEPQARELGLMPAMYPDISGPFGERTITVKGKTIDIVSSAEQKISQKLRLSFETDLQSRSLYPTPGAPIPGLGGAVPPLVAANPMEQFAALNISAAAAAASRPGFPIPPMIAAQMAASAQVSKTIKLWVPNTMVGAIIGSKGAHIRNIMRVTGAHIRIEGNGEKKREREEAKSSTEEEPKDDHKDEDSTVEKEDRLGGGDESGGEKKEDEAGSIKKKRIPRPPPPEEEGDERLVTIQGIDSQLYRAQYCIYARVAEQSQCFFDEVKLRTELNVPSRLVGRIIGKGGQNVRELQRITGAQVKVAEELGDGDSPSASPGVEDTTAVRITGNFNATQAVQCRVSQLLAEYYARHANRPSPPAHHHAPSTSTADKTGATSSSVAPQSSPTGGTTSGLPTNTDESSSSPPPTEDATAAGSPTTE